MGGGACFGAGFWPGTKAAAAALSFGMGGGAAVIVACWGTGTGVTVASPGTGARGDRRLLGDRARHGRETLRHGARDDRRLLGHRARDGHRPMRDWGLGDVLDHRHLVADRQAGQASGPDVIPRPPPGG